MPAPDGEPEEAVCRRLPGQCVDSSSLWQTTVAQLARHRLLGYEPCTILQGSSLTERKLPCGGAHPGYPTVSGAVLRTRSATTLQAIGREECVSLLVAHNPIGFYRHDKGRDVHCTRCVPRGKEGPLDEKWF